MSKRPLKPSTHQWAFDDTKSLKNDDKISLCVYIITDKYAVILKHLRIPSASDSVYLGI